MIQVIVSNVKKIQTGRNKNTGFPFLLLLSRSLSFAFLMQK